MLGAAACALASPASRASDAACPPAAAVGGDSAAAVASILRDRGVAAPRARCPAVTATVERQGEELVVTIVDEAGRESVRRASTPAAVATIVESWAMDDAASELLLPRAPTTRVIASAGDSNDSGARAVAATANAASAGEAAEAWVLLDARFESAMALDGSFWPGAAVGVCFRIGPVCAGGFGRASVDSSLIGASADRETGRVALDGFATVDAMFEIGDFTVRPGGFVGAGWMQSRNSPVWAAPPENNVEIDGGGMRGGAGVAIGMPLGDTFALNLNVSADAALLAHTTPFQEESETLAGEPLAFLRFGIGFGARK